MKGSLAGGMEVWIASGKPMADRFEIVHAERTREAIAEGVTVLDVRRPNEYEAGHVEGAIHVPLGSLEEGFDRLPEDQPVLAHGGYGGRNPQLSLSLKERKSVGW